MEKSGPCTLFVGMSVSMVLMINSMRVSYSSVKQSEVMSFAGKLMKPKSIMLSEINQTQQNKDHVFSQYVEC